jgi:transposase-like protein
MEREESASENGVMTDEVVHENARSCTIAAGGRVESEPGMSDRQRTAIELMLHGKSLGAVARDMGVNPSTLYRWRQDEVFRVELDRRRREIWEGAAERLRALVHPAIDVLEAEVHDEYDRSRVRAAGMILRFADLRKSVPPKKEED